LYEFTASGSEEISLKIGEFVTFDSEQDGWTFITNSDGKYGRVPTTYLKKN
jgi:hypothetical protein